MRQFILGAGQGFETIGIIKASPAKEGDALRNLSFYIELSLFCRLKIIRRQSFALKGRESL